jgi:CRP/FNR family cyclic AMP-dependent transcriptional regulator
MGRQEELADELATFGLFADLNMPQVRGLADRFEEESFQQGVKVLRQGLSGAGFYVILEGEAAVQVDGEDRATLQRGEFFGEVSILLGEPPVADIVARRDLRCLVLAGDQVQDLLTSFPIVMYRMLQEQARRLRRANQWRS